MAEKRERIERRDVGEEVAAGRGDVIPGLGGQRGTIIGPVGNKARGDQQRI